MNKEVREEWGWRLKKKNQACKCLDLVGGKWETTGNFKQRMRWPDLYFGDNA